jgi:hypothetical protein
MASAGDEVRDRVARRAPRLDREIAGIDDSALRAAHRVSKHFSAAYAYLMAADTTDLPSKPTPQEYADLALAHLDTTQNQIDAIRQAARSDQQARVLADWLTDGEFDESVSLLKSLTLAVKVRSGEVALRQTGRDAYESLPQAYRKRYPADRSSLLSLLYETNSADSN